MNEQQPIRYSRFWERVGAALADGVLLYVPMAILYVWVDIVMDKYQWVYWTLGTCYYVLLEGPMGRGQTLGKKLFGLRVLSKEGQVLSYEQSLKRYLILSILPGMSSWMAFHYMGKPGAADWAAFATQQLVSLYVWTDIIVLAKDLQKRSLHDYLSGTVVLKTGSVVPETWPENVEPLASAFPWKRLGPSMAIVCGFAGILSLFNVTVKMSQADRPKFALRQPFHRFGIFVKNAETHDDRPSQWLLFHLWAQ